MPQAITPELEKERRRSWPLGTLERQGRREKSDSVVHLVVSVEFVGS